MKIRMKARTSALGLALALTFATSLYAATPTLEWTRQLGTIGNNLSRGVSADSLGNVYISGTTGGSLGGSNAGGFDVYVSKFDASGTLAWIKQLGTISNDAGRGVSADSLGNVYITGFTNGGPGGLGGPISANLGMGAFVSKFDASGTLLWTEQLGTSSFDGNFGVSADSLGNVYISGHTLGSLGGPNAGSEDVFVSKYDASGTLLWTEQLGTSASDVSFGVSADSLGNVYISGNTQGSLGGPNAGSEDAFVSKYDASGTLLWTEQLGTSSFDGSFGVSADSLGNVYISGSTFGNLGGPNHGDRDAFVSKYNASGTLLWTEQLGTSGSDGSFGVSADSLGNVYISGNTAGSLGGPNAGGRDALLVKFHDPIPEPGAFALAMLGLVTLGLVPRRRVNQ